MNKRRNLVALVKLMFVGVVLSFAYLFVSGMLTTSPDKQGVVEIINIQNLKPGGILKLKMKYPVWILRRTTEMQKNLASPAELADPESLLSTQPAAAKNNLRSLKAEYFIFVPMFDMKNKSNNRRYYVNVIEIPEVRKRSRSMAFADAAYNLQFDYAGRVFKYNRLNWLEQANNLIVPEHEFISDIKIKVDLTKLRLISDLF